MNGRGGFPTFQIFQRAVAVTILICFFAQTILPSPAFGAQILPVPASAAPGLTAEYRPALAQGMTLFPDNPFRLEFIVDPGQEALTKDEFRDESTRLVKYFLASLTTPEKEMSVNLNPAQPDRIIPASLGLTEMGRDLLSQDYLLKQLSSALTNPEQDLGRKFWDEIYRQGAASRICRGTACRAPTDLSEILGKIWIVP